MKSVKTYAGIAFLTFAMASCTQDEPAFTPVEPGMEIQFGAALSPDNPQKTRTYYQPYLDGQSSWKVYWNHSENSADLDHIFVYSPQANTGRNQASYTVKPGAPYLTTAAEITKDGSYGVQAGADTKNYDFYGIYPASAVKGTANNGQVTATLNGAQTVTYTGTDNKQTAAAVTIPKPDDMTATQKYYTKPDMKQALLVCNKHVDDLTTENPVSLPFKPFATCLDIVINGPETNTNMPVARVTSVMIESDANHPISGDFTYDFTSGKIVGYGDNKSNVINVNTKGLDAAGNEVGIPLKTGDELHVQAFILPTEGLSTLKVTVNTSDFKSYVKNLNVTTAAPIQPGQIHTVKLPKIKASEGQFNYAVWLSQLDPRIYISEISLPGSAAAFSYNLADTDGDNKCRRQQTLTLKQQFESGIRVFQTHAWIQGQTSAVDGGNTSICINANDQSVRKSDGTYLTLWDVVNELRREMQNSHSDEFCILMISDYRNNGYTEAQFLSRLKELLSRMGDDVVTNFGPNTIIGDIKGKVLVKLAIHGDNSSLTGTNALFNLWVNGSEKQVNYSTLKWANATGLSNNGSFTAPSGDNMLFIHAEQANPTNGYSANGVSWNTVYTGDQIDRYFQYYSSSTHNIFGMSYLGGSGNYYTARENISTGRIPNWQTVYHYYTPTQVAQHFNQIWLDKVNARIGDAKPYGWVLFNSVGGTFTNNTYSTQTCIQKVISQNNDNNFTLNRKKPTTSPNGDVGGSPFGGKLF